MEGGTGGQADVGTYDRWMDGWMDGWMGGYCRLSGAKLLSLPYPPTSCVVSRQMLLQKTEVGQYECTSTWTIRCLCQPHQRTAGLFRSLSGNTFDAPNHSTDAYHSHNRCFS